MDNITQCVDGGLHLLTVIDGEVTLGHGVELMTEEDNAGSLVRLEEGFDGSLELTGCLFWLDGGAKDIVCQGVAQLALHGRR